jgi:hypothetical protein
VKRTLLNGKVKGLGRSKIGDFDHHVAVDQEILGFEVSAVELPLMEVCNTVTKLVHERADHEWI